MKELNGFAIEKWNVYDLPESAKTSTCPLCSESRKKKKDKCLSIKWEKGLADCHHCEETIQLHEYVKNKATSVVYSKPNPPSRYNLSDKVLKFFEGRKISQRALKIAKVSEGFDWMPQFNREIETIHFNYFLYGELINIKYRAPKKAFKLAKDAELIVSGIDRWMHEDDVILTEGEIDELSFIEAGFSNVSSVPNGGGSANLQYLDNSYKFFENKKKIYLCVDSDDVGKKLEAELIRRLGAERCYIVDLGDYKDANEALMNEGVEFLQAAIFEAKLTPLENVKTYESIKDQYRRFILEGMPSGYKTGLVSFDNIFSTYTKQFVTVTGIPTHGKSDFVDQMCIGYALNYGFKTAYLSVENNPEYLHVNKIIQKIYGREPNNLDFDNELFNYIESFVEDHFFFMNFDESDELADLDTALSKGSELVKRKGIRVLVLDPFNKIPMKGINRERTNEYTTAYLNKIDAWGKKNDCIVIPVAHPVKMKAQGTNKMPEPSFYDIKGGGEWYDMSPHGLSVYRDFELSLVKIKVMKVKFSNLGVNQAHVWFAWNPRNGRYTEVGGDVDDGDEITPFWDEMPWLQLPENEKQKKDEEIRYDGYSEECGF